MCYKAGTLALTMCKDSFHGKQLRSMVYGSIGRLGLDQTNFSPHSAVASFTNCLIFCSSCLRTTSKASFVLTTM